MRGLLGFTMCLLDRPRVYAVWVCGVVGYFLVSLRASNAAYRRFRLAGTRLKDNSKIHFGTYSATTCLLLSTSADARAAHHQIEIGDERERLVAASPMITRAEAPAGIKRITRRTAS
jgi:hypothetical protein